MAKKRQTFSVPPTKRQSRSTVRMEVIPEDIDTRGISVIHSSVAPAMRGEGSIDYTCGECGVVICEGMNPARIQHLAFDCPECETTNRITSPDVV